MYWNIGPRAVPAPAAPAAPALSYSERMQARRGARSTRGPGLLSAAAAAGPAKGDRRADGKFYTGEAYGWQTAPAAARGGLLGSEVLGDAAFARSSGPSPGGGQAPITPAVTPVFRNSGAGNASVARQNAAQGVKAQSSYWEANPEIARAVQARGEAAQAARNAQGGRGYLSAMAPAQAGLAFDAAAAPGVELGQVAPQNFSMNPAQEQQGFEAGLPVTALARGAATTTFSPAAAGGLPDTSNPASDSYWQRADIREWADKNGELATQLRGRHGLSPWSPGMGQQQQVPDVAPAGFNPTQTVFSEPTAPIGSDPAQRMAPNQMRSGPETEADLAQALKTEHLQSIKAALRGNENLTSPSYFQPNDQYQQPSWPWGQR